MFTTRRSTRILLGALSTVLVVAAFGCGPVTSNPTPAVTPDRAGFSSGGGILWESDSDLAHDLDAVASTGAKWLRLDFDWKSIQSQGPTYWRWDYQDRVVNAARARGLQVLAVPTYSPPWARQASCSSSMYCPPANPASYATFVHALAARYAPLGVHAYEIWNEPNWAPWWIGAPNAPAYVAVLKAAYPAIHSADPDATVITGGLAPHGDLNANPTDPISPVNFLKAMYAAGAQGSFDAFGLHPYPPLPSDPLSGKIGWNALLQTSMEHDIMAAHGDGAKKIWGTEYGAPTGSSDPKVVSESAQAQYVATGLNYWASLSYTGPLFVDTIRDWSPSASNDWSAYMGLLHVDFSPKPALTTMKNTITQP
jgi:cellulase (glycosyl hydrolase family 5)